MSKVRQIKDEYIYRAIAEFFRNPEEAVGHARNKFIKWGFYLIPIKYVIYKAAQLQGIDLRYDEFVTDDAIYRLRKLKDIEIIETKTPDRP